MEYLALFLNHELEVIGSKKFKAIDQTVVFKKSTCYVRLDAYLLKMKGVYFYGYIYPTDEILLIDTKLEPIKKTTKEGKEIQANLCSARLVAIKERMDKNDLWLFVTQSVVGQLARAIYAGIKQNWLMIVLIGVVAFIGGLGIGYGIHGATTTIINNSTSTTPTTLPTVIPTLPPINIGG